MKKQTPDVRVNQLFQRRKVRNSVFYEVIKVTIRLIQWDTVFCSKKQNNHSTRKQICRECSVTLSPSNWSASKNLEFPDCSCSTVAFQLTCSQKSQVSRLQLWPSCLPIGPATKKFELPDWSYSPVAFQQGLPPKISSVVVNLLFYS